MPGFFFTCFKQKIPLYTDSKQKQRLFHTQTDSHKERDVVTSKGCHRRGVRWSLFSRTPVLLLLSTMRAFEVSSPLSFVVILKRAEPSVLHIIVVIFLIFTQALICYQSLRAFPTATICLRFDLFHCRIIWRWPLMFSQDSWRVIDRFCTVCLCGVIYLFSRPKITLINLLM